MKNDVKHNNDGKRTAIKTETSYIWKTNKTCTWKPKILMTLTSNGVPYCTVTGLIAH